MIIIKYHSLKKAKGSSAFLVYCKNEVYENYVIIKIYFNGTIV